MYRLFSTRLILFAGLLISSAWIISSCNKDEAFTVDYKYNYFPLTVGSWIEYQVDSITYDNNFDPPKVDTVSFTLKEVIESQFTDASNNPAYRIERYRMDSTGQYNLMNVVYESLLNKEADRIEGNLRYIKMIFPINETTVWSGNSRIDATGDNAYLAGWQYSVTTIDVPMTVGSLAFDSTVTILQVDDENLIEKKYSTETYAKGVGLISKETLHLQKQNVTNGWDKPEEGFILRMSIIGHG